MVLLIIIIIGIHIFAINYFLYSIQYSNIDSIKNCERIEYKKKTKSHQTQAARNRNFLINQIVTYLLCKFYVLALFTVRPDNDDRVSDGKEHASSTSSVSVFLALRVCFQFVAAAIGSQCDNEPQKRDFSAGSLSQV